MLYFLKITEGASNNNMYQQLCKNGYLGSIAFPAILVLHYLATTSIIGNIVSKVNMALLVVVVSKKYGAPIEIIFL